MSSIAVLGIGVSGFSALKLAHSKGLHVLAINSGRPETWKNFKQVVALISEKSCFNENDVSLDFLRGLEYLVVSPGISEDNPVLQKAKQIELKLISELEFGYQFLNDEKIVAITGTNGKTTSCTMLSQLLEIAGISHFLGGNIGTPLSEYLLQGDPKEYLILELSSFQLEKVHQFHAHYACILNIEENHMERYQSFDSYAGAKFNIFNRQQASDVSILFENLKVFFKDQLDSKVIAITHEQVDDLKKKYQELPHSFVGNYTWINLCFVYTIASSMEVPDLESAFKKLIQKFKGVPHRLQFIAKKGSISFYNDAKSTNWFATKSALESLTDQRNIVLILGGKSRDGREAQVDPDVLPTELLDKILLIGETSTGLKSVFGDLALECGNLEKAFSWIKENAKESATILFSPGYPSFDQYQNYVQRGEHFASLVKRF